MSKRQYKGNNATSLRSTMVDEVSRKESERIGPLGDFLGLPCFLSPSML